MLVFTSQVAIPTEPNGGNHTPGFIRAAASQEGHDETLKVAKVLALTGFRVLDDDQFFSKVRNTIRESSIER